MRRCFCGLMDEGLRETLYPTPALPAPCPGQGQWEGAWEVTRSMKQKSALCQHPPPPMDAHGCLGPCPPPQAHIPVMNPQEESKQGHGALWMDSAHAPRPQESRVKNILSCNIHKAQERTPSPRVHQTPTQILSALPTSNCFPPCSASLCEH